MPATKLPWPTIITTAEEQCGRLNRILLDQAILEAKALREARAARQRRRNREAVRSRAR